MLVKGAVPGGKNGLVADPHGLRAPCQSIQRHTKENTDMSKFEVMNSEGEQGH